MNQQDYIDRGDLTTVEHVLANLLCIDPETSSVINHKDFTKVEVALRTWRQELSELMITKMKEDTVKELNGSGQTDPKHQNPET